MGPALNNFRHVTSKHNAALKELRLLLSRPGQDEDGWIAFEGERLLREAVRSGVTFKSLFISADAKSRLDTLLPAPEANVVLVPQEIFSSISSTQAPQGIAAIARPQRYGLEDVLRGPNPLIMIAASLQDPGNFGTLVRSAEAFEANGVLALPGTVSPWNQKALRASAGSAFRVPVVSLKVSDLSMLRARDIPIYAAGSRAGAPATALDLTKPAAILIGNEGSGVSPELLALADSGITIPCPGRVESLNAGVAASLLLYEASRQRASKHSPPGGTAASANRR